MIDTLPNELIENILVHLDIHSVLKVANVNKRLYENCKYILDNKWKELFQNEEIFITTPKKEKIILSLEEKKIYTCIVHRLHKIIKKGPRYDKIYLSIVTNFAKKVVSTSHSYYNETFTIIIYSPIDSFLIEKLLKLTTVINYPIKDINNNNVVKNNCIYLFRSTYSVLSEHWNY